MFENSDRRHKIHQHLPYDYDQKADGYFKNKIKKYDSYCNVGSALLAYAIAFSNVPTGERLKLKNMTVIIGNCIRTFIMEKIKSISEVTNNLTRFSLGETISFLNSIQQLAPIYFFED